MTSVSSLTSSTASALAACTPSSRLGYYDGLRHCQDAELRARRRHHDRRVRLPSAPRSTWGMSAAGLAFCLPWWCAPRWALSSSGWPISRCVRRRALAVLITAIGVSYLLQNSCAADLGFRAEQPCRSRHFARHPVHQPDGRPARSSDRRNDRDRAGQHHHHGWRSRSFTCHTKFGKAMRAVSPKTSGAAELMGINVNATHFPDLRHRLRAGGDCGRAALLRLPHARCRRPAPCRASRRSRRLSSAASDPFRARCSAVVLLGMIEILGKAYVSTELGDALVFAVLIIVLLVKPTGLLGKPDAGESVTG